MSETAFVLILTADEEAGQRLREILRERFEHSCSVVTELDAALKSIRARTPDVVVTPAELEGEPAAVLLAEQLAQLSQDATLGVFGDAKPPEIAHPYVALIKPGDDVDQFAKAVDKLAGQAVGRRADRLLQANLDEQRDAVFEGIVGVSPGIRRIIERIRKVAPSKLTVLITGETGTGKEVIAEAIHRVSDRSHRPLMALNCAGLNENLLESELFGHVKGAYTGAFADRKGYFVAADGGTLFLDEIGDMPLTMQAKLLRALERREITPVGSTEVKRVDVRVIAATNADLHQKVDDKEFREDLYYRLNQWVIELPPLRERREDVPLLADHFRRRANREHGLSCEGIASEAMALLSKYYWPGNVRELANVIEAAVVEVSERRIEVDDLPERVRGSREIVPTAAGMVGLTMAQVEKMMIERTLQATGGNREQAAKILDIGTRTLYRKIKDYGL